jgi:hypothetical protein
MAYKSTRVGFLPVALVNLAALRVSQLCRYDLAMVASRALW